MKTIHIILTAVILSALCGCRSHRNQTPVPETVTLQATMSTREVHTRHTDEAQIRPDGSLRHSLRHKNTPLPVQVTVTTDTIYKDRVIEKPVPVKVHDTAPSDHAKSYRSTVLPWLIATATTILLVLIAVKHLRTRF